jgi:hypothetical protein
MWPERKVFSYYPHSRTPKSLSLKYLGVGTKTKTTAFLPQVDAIISLERRRITNKTKKKDVCPASSWWITFVWGRGWWTICHLPGDNSGLNTKKELGKCFLINLGRWSSFVGSWGQKAVFGFWNSLNGGERKKKTSANKRLFYYYPMREKRTKRNVRVTSCQIAFAMWTWGV